MTMDIKNILIAFAILVVYTFAIFQYGRYKGKEELKADAAVRGDSTVQTTSSTQETLIPQKPKTYHSLKPRILNDTTYQHVVDSLKGTNRDKDSLLAFYEMPREFTFGDTTTAIAIIRIYPAEGYRTEPMIIPAPVRVETKTIDREVERLVYVNPTFWDKLQYYAEGAVVGGVIVGVVVVTHSGKL